MKKNMNRNGILAALALSALALAVLWGCTSSDVDDPGADVYLVAYVKSYSLNCATGGNQFTFTLENRPKQSSAVNSLNDVQVRRFTLTSTNTGVIPNTAGSIADTFVKVNGKADLTLNNVFDPALFCTAGADVEILMTFFGETIGGDFVSDDTTMVVTLTCPVVGATASVDNATVNFGTAQNFTGSGSGGTVPYTYSWDFGDGGSSTLQNPTYTYAAAGSYIVTFTVTDSCLLGATTGADVLGVTVNCPAVTATAGVNNATVTLLTAQNFTGTATGGTAPYTYSWNFGDGVGTSTAQNPTYTYAAAGSYTVTLTVFDSCLPAAATDIDTLPVTVNP